MGLDTSHDCWHGPYSAFHEWRKHLMQIAYHMNIDEMHGFGGSIPWVGMDDALMVLLNHSDCDGEIEAHYCAPLADRLEELLPKVEGWYFTEATQNFIAGLRRAARAGEAVDFS